VSVLRKWASCLWKSSTSARRRRSVVAERSVRGCSRALLGAGDAAVRGRQSLQALQRNALAAHGAHTVAAAVDAAQGTIDLVHSSWDAAHGNRSLDLYGGQVGGIEQMIEGLTPGSRYRLDFYMAGNPSDYKIKEMLVQVGDASEEFSFDITGKGLSNMGWKHMTLVFTATSETETLQFLSLPPPGAYPTTRGPALDNVSIFELP